MELDWTTFLLEIANFIVLVWILQRFLYQPIRAAITRRQDAVEQILCEARALQEKATDLAQRYENRLAEWNVEREKRRTVLEAEIEEERTRRLESLSVELDAQREKRRVLDERKITELRQATEERAVAQAGAFVGRLLARLASPELEQRLVRLFVDDLHSLPEERRRSLRNGVGPDPRGLVVASAYPLSPECRATLTAAMGELVAGGAACEFREDPALLAGLRVALGPWVLQANLRDELGFFLEGRTLDGLG